MGQDTFAESITTLQTRLQEKAIPKTKAWWESYLKQVISFRGVKMPTIRAVLHDWYAESIEQRLTLAEKKHLALDLFRGEYAEDKLAGILFLQEILLPAGAIVWQTDIPRFASLFTNGWIYDWNTCDWFCVKVLGPLIRREGRACAEAIAAWRRAENLWQARAAVVAFVGVADNSDYYPLIGDSCQVLIRWRERFAKTAVGWILRDISKQDKMWVKTFIEGNLSHFSNESLKNATKHFDQDERTTYLRLLKSA